MEVKTPSEVVKLIRANILRIRNGLWLLPTISLGQERNEAARLLVDAVDLRQRLIQHLPADTRFIGLNDQKVIELLDEVAEQEGQSDCALVYNLDLLLSHLKQKDIKYVWQHLIESMPHRSCALLITMPALATDLLPSDEQMVQLAREKRLADTAK